jgi:hypothetical protein
MQPLTNSNTKLKHFCADVMQNMKAIIWYVFTNRGTTTDSLNWHAVVEGDFSQTPTNANKF